MVCSCDTHTCTLEITASLYSMALPCPTFTKGDESERIRNVSDERIASQTVDILRILGIGNISNENILFRDVYRWEAVGPLSRKVVMETGVTCSNGHREGFF